MKKLLTIEEAANLLNTSKTSLRRWTNDGRLACVRIGARRERRFRIEDLERFIAAGTETGPSPTAPSSPVFSDLVGSSGGDSAVAVLDRAAKSGSPRHVSLHFRTRDEHWALFRPYLAHHLARRQPVFYVYDDQQGRGDRDRDDLESRLRGEGYEPAELTEDGLLTLIPASKAYLKTGTFSASRMIDFMEAAILNMRASGHTIGLISGEMTWYLTGVDGVKDMIAYELRLNDLLQRYPDITIVCHYDIERLDSDVTLGALCSHPHVQLSDRLVPGYYRADAR